MSAILKHGSYLRFGCLQFVFGVMDYNNDNEQDDTAILSLTKRSKNVPEVKSKEEVKEEVETEEEKEKNDQNEKEEVKMEEDSADE